MASESKPSKPIFSNPNYYDIDVNHPPNELGISEIIQNKANESFKDSLTGLYNRAYGKENLNKRLNSETMRENLSLARIDIDNFKDINDTFGHNKGDEALVETAHGLQEAFRKDEIIYRMGGDEFDIILPGVGKAEALMIIDRIKNVGKKINLSYSVGIATLEKGESSKPIDEFIREADEAMYQDKGYKRR